MTNSQKLTIKASEIRTRLNEISLLEGEALTDEVRAEETKLQTEYRDVETKLRAAIAAEPDPEQRTAEPVDAEERERRELRGRSRLGAYIGSFLNGRVLSGAESELSEAEGCPGMVPFALLAPETREAEHRLVTPAPSTVGTTMHPTLPGVFLAPAADALRVEQPSVGAGTQAYPVLTTDVTMGARDKGVAGPETAGAITVTTTDFKRVTGAFRIAVEDVQKLDTLETTLRENLSSVLMDGIDDFVLNGVVAVNNVVSAVPGFFSAASPLVTAAGAETDTDTFDTFMEKFAGALDGKYARMLDAISLVTGPETLGKMARTYLSGTPLSAYREARETYRGVTGTDRVAVASNVQKGIFVRHSVPGRVAVSPRWSGAGFDGTIRDPYSGASKGEVVLTMFAMVGEPKVLRPNVYKGASFKVA